MNFVLLWGRSFFWMWASRGKKTGPVGPRPPFLNRHEPRDVQLPFGIFDGRVVPELDETHLESGTLALELLLHRQRETSSQSSHYATVNAPVYFAVEYILRSWTLP